MNATVVHLEDEFKKFGPIKSGGIQVRSNKVVYNFSTANAFCNHIEFWISMFSLRKLGNLQGKTYWEITDSDTLMILIVAISFAFVHAATRFLLWFCGVREFKCCSRCIGGIHLFVVCSFWSFIIISWCRGWFFIILVVYCLLMKNFKKHFCWATEWEAHCVAYEVRTQNSFLIAL